MLFFESDLRLAMQMDTKNKRLICYLFGVVWLLVLTVLMTGVTLHNGDTISV